MVLPFSSFTEIMPPTEPVPDTVAFFVTSSGKSTFASGAGTDDLPGLTVISVRVRL